MELHLKRTDKWKLEMWDCSGELCFAPLLRPYFKSAHCVLLVYSPSVSSSFDIVEKLASEIGGKALVVANCDSPQAEAEHSCTQAGVSFLQVSPATPELLFERAVQIALSCH